MKTLYWKARRKLALYLWDIGAALELIGTRNDQATAKRLREERKRLERAFERIP